MVWFCVILRCTPKLKMPFWSIFGHSIGAYCRLLQADLDGKVSPLDLPFQIVLTGAILFNSEMHSKIENTKSPWCFGRFLAILKGAYFRLLRADLDGKVLPLDSPFRVLLDSVVSCDSETHSKIENTKTIALVFWLIFGHSKWGLFSAPAGRFGWESIATRFALLSTTR